MNLVVKGLVSVASVPLHLRHAATPTATRGRLARTSSLTFSIEVGGRLVAGGHRA